MYPSFDAGASVRIWAVEATIAGRQLRIPPLPASEWLPYVMAGNLVGIRELLEDFDLTDALADDEFTMDSFKEALTLLVESAAGRVWNAALAIAAAAASRWDVVGADLAYRGVRFDLISLGAALDAMYGSLLRHLDENGQKQFIKLVMDGPTTSQDRAPKNAKPLPASALQYVQTRPKTQLRRPQDLPDAPSEPPRPPLRPRTGSAPLPTSAPLPPEVAAGGDERPPGGEPASGTGSPRRPIRPSPPAS